MTRFPLLLALILLTLGIATPAQSAGATAALLYRTDAGLATANALIAASATAYPGVACTPVKLDLPSDATAAQLYAAVAGKIDRLQYAYLQLMPDIPVATRWPGKYPGVSCGVNAGDTWSTANLLMGEWTTADSPPDSASAGWCVFRDYSWQPIQRVAHLTGTPEQVAAKIALACAAPMAGGGAILDGPGKAGLANNARTPSPRIQTYWQSAWNVGGWYNLKTRAGLPFPILNDLTGYKGAGADYIDTANDLPAGATVNQTGAAPWPVAYLQVHGGHQNGDSQFGPAWPGLAAYAGIGLAPRAVVVEDSSFSAKGANIDQWHSVPAAAFIGNVNEPCRLGLQSAVFCNAYLRDGLALGDAHALALQSYVRGPDMALFGVAWMTAR